MPTAAIKRTIPKIVAITFLLFELSPLFEAGVVINGSVGGGFVPKPAAVSEAVSAGGLVGGSPGVEKGDSV